MHRLLTYKKADLKAPRFRHTIYRVFNLDFCKKIRNKGGAFKKLNDKEIRKIICSFNGKIWQGVIDNRDGVELPEQLGYVFVGTCPKPAKYNTDMNKSSSIGVRVQHQNWESDQYLCKIFYTNFETKYGFKNHELWGFTAFRLFKRSVSSVYHIEWKKYVVVESIARVCSLFRRYVLRDENLERTQALLETYDEFDMD